MCGKKHHQLKMAAPGAPAEGATVRLTDRPAGEGPRPCGGFPWWTLWMIWPLFWLAKGAFALAAPLVAWLSQPLLLTITPLPLLLVGAGLALLLLRARHG